MADSPSAPSRPLAATAAGRPSGRSWVVHHGRECSIAVVEGFREHDLLTYASAISFQILTAVVPFLLFVLAMAGILHVSGLWQDHLVPQLRAHVSPAMFSVVSGAVDTVLASRRLLWATLGGGLALWQVSGAVRAVMGALGRIYGAPGERPFLRRYAVSFALSLAVGGCFILAAVSLVLAPFLAVAHLGLLWHVVGFVVRWGLVLAFLFLSVGILVRHAPALEQTLPWVSFGAGLVIVTWVAMSLLFDLYLTDLASYQSVFGSLAAVIVAMGYLYTSTIVFLFGAQLDAIVRDRATDSRSGVPAAGRVTA